MIPAPVSAILPNLFVVGVARGGTTSLWYCLRQHPDIFMSLVKEPYYFSDSYKVSLPIPKERATYLSLFAAGRGFRWRGEASTAYFWDPACATRIKEFNPQARIIVSLRNPTDRAYSEYLHNYSTGGERLAFGPALRELLDAEERNPRRDFLVSGNYVSELKRYLDLFGHNLHVLFFEEFRASPREELRKIFAFLDVDTAPADELDITPQNTSLVPRRFARLPLSLPVIRSLPQPARERLLFRRGTTVVPPEVRRLLDAHYRAERDPLERLLRRPLPWPDNDD